MWQSQPSDPQWLPQRVGEGWEDEGPTRWHTLVNLCVCAAVGTFLSVSFDGVNLWTCGSLKGTQRDCFECVYCLPIASRWGCRAVSGMATPSRCRALVDNQMSMVCERLGHNCLAMLRVVIAVVGPH